MTDTHARRPLNISPSQIKRFSPDFKGCARKTAFQLNTDLRPPVDPLPRATHLGTRCHTIAEEWLRFGAEPDLLETFTYYRRVFDRATGEHIETPETVHPGAIVSAGLHLLPAPKDPSVNIETPLQWQGTHGPWKSRADWTTAPAGIGDHKFVRDIGSALSATEGSRNSYGDPNFLGDDPQAIIQAGAMVARGAEEVPLTWVNYQTRITGGKHKAKRVHLVVTRDHVLDRMVELDKWAALTQAVYQHRIQPLDLPPAPESCNAYGSRCEWADTCNLTPEQQHEGLFKMSTPMEEIENVIADLKSRALGPTVIGAAPPPPPAWMSPTPAVPPPPPPPPPPPVPDGYTVGTKAQTDAVSARIKDMIDLSNAYALMGPDPVNPPEAAQAPDDGTFGPMPDAVTVDAVLVPVGGLDAMDRPTLKAWLVERDLIKSGDRRGLPALLEVAKAHAAGKVEILFGIDHAAPAPSTLPTLEDLTHPELTAEAIDVPEPSVPPDACTFAEVNAELRRLRDRIEELEREPS